MEFSTSGTAGGRGATTDAAATRFAHVLPGAARRLAAVTLALAAVGCSPTPGRADKEVAGDLLESALETLGSPAALASFGVFEARANGTLDKAAEGQGFSPDRPSPGPYEEVFVVDAAAGRIAWEYREERYDGTYEAFREAYPAPGERLYVVHDPPLAIPARSASFDAPRRQLLRRIPHLALAELLERPEELRVTESGRPGATVVGRLADGTELAVALDEHGRPVELGFVAHLSGKGDTEIVWWFDDYRPVDGLGSFPFRYGSRVGGQPYTTMQVEGVTKAGPEAFAAPAGYKRLPEREVDPRGQSEPAPLEMEELAPGVYRVPEVRGGFAPLVIAQPDGLIVVDAPASFPVLGKLPPEETDAAASFSWHSERVVDALARRFPDRPLRFLVLTHAHEDHIGGVRAFVAAGATVLAAPPVRPAVQRVVGLGAVPDRLATTPRPLRFEAVGGTRVIGDGPLRVEVLPVGENPHAEGLVVVAMPGQRLMFVSDLVTPGSLDTYPPAAHAALDSFFAGWLIERGLRPERIVAMHGAPFATADHLARAAQLAESGG